MKWLAIDPGTRESGWVHFDGERVFGAGVSANEDMLRAIREQPVGYCMAIEKIVAMGMAVGDEVFETVHWSGRFFEAWPWPSAVARIPRRDVKLYLCGSLRAKDSNIRQALIDALGPPGTKSKPGPTHGVRSHAWAALAVAVTAEAQIARRYLPTPIERVAPSSATLSNEEFFS